MAGIHVSLDDDAFGRALDRWALYSGWEGRQGNHDAAGAVRDEAIGAVVRLFHEPHTKTPSAPRNPPAVITGTLASSFAVNDEADYSEIGPTTYASSYNGPYARIQELGGAMTAHNHTGRMHWFEDGRWHRAANVDLPSRPYLKPSVEELVRNGEILHIYRDRWAFAQHMAI